MVLQSFHLLFLLFHVEDLKLSGGIAAAAKRGKEVAEGVQKHVPQGQSMEENPN